MAHEELVLKLLHHQTASSGGASPMDVAEGVAGTIIAHGDELLGFTNGSRQGHTTLLVFMPAGQRQCRQRVTPGQNQNRFRERNPQKCSKQAKGIALSE